MPASKTVPETDWNELIIARLYKGETTVWRGWKKSIAVFANPRMWTDPDAWSSAGLTPEPERAWGFAGYGLVAVDMDNLLDDPLARDDEVFPMGWLLEELIQRLYLGPLADNTALSAILDPSMSLDQRRAALTLEHGAYLKIGGRNATFLSAELTLPGWTKHDTRGQEQPQFSLEMLELMRANGFDHPDLESVREHLDDCFEEIGTGEEDDGSDCDPPDAYALALRERRLQVLDAWKSPVATSPKPGQVN